MYLILIRVDGFDLTLGQIRFSLLDLSGKVLYKGVVQDDKTVHLLNEMNGLYILSLEQGSNVQAFKIIIQ